MFLKSQKPFWNFEDKRLFDQLTNSNKTIVNTKINIGKHGPSNSIKRSSTIENQINFLKTNCQNYSQVLEILRNKDF